MTKEEILAMEAGRELDRSVAESLGYEVKSWETFQGEPIYHYRVPSQYGEVWELLLKYSTDISAAWQVVEKNDYSWFDVWRAYGKFYAKVRDGRLKGLEVVAGPCETAPVAISKVALLAIHSQKNI